MISSIKTLELLDTRENLLIWNDDAIPAPYQGTALAVPNGYLTGWASAPAAFRAAK
jgi:hypothetical protein